MRNSACWCRIVGKAKIRWTQTAFYLNIFRIIEKTLKWFCVSTYMQCVTKIPNSIGWTYLVYCFNYTKQIFFDFPEKCPTAGL